MEKQLARLREGVGFGVVGFWDFRALGFEVSGFRVGV